MKNVLEIRWNTCLTAFCEFLTNKEKVLLSLLKEKLVDDVNLQKHFIIECHALLEL